jgi:amino acid transporter
MLSRLFRTLIGAPLATDQAGHQRINKLTALAVFSSDALSSVAYATQEIFLTVSIMGAAAFSLSLPIAAAICVLLVVLTASYRQTIFAYPTGGGAYIVAKDNLGTFPGLVAGGALLVDYVLTVSVSIAGGIQAVTSTSDALKPHAVGLCLVAVAIVTIGNLRGVKESGRIFSVPTYFFVVMMLALMAVGIFKQPHQSQEAMRLMMKPVIPPSVGPFLILHGFASGCAALTGVEAISNGVPAFEKPEPKNAAATMVWMALVLGSLFVGVTLLSHVYGAEYHSLEHFVSTIGGGKETAAAKAAFEGQNSVLSQVAFKVFNGGPAYYVMQAATAAILLLAANTSFADFPRLASLLATDGFLPRQLAMRGDRLVFSNGIIILAGFASLLIVVFGGSTDALVPLYAVGVFVSFTLSQAGMVVHWFKDRKGTWWARAGMNGLGAVVTAVVLLVIAFTKFMDGAWIVVLLIPLIVLGFQAIKRHYGVAGRQLRLEGTEMPPQPAHHTVIVPIAGIHRGVLTALSYAMSISDDVTAVAVDIDPAATERLRVAWAKLELKGVELEILPSPYRSLVQPLLDYIDKVEDKRDDDIVTVVLPEFVPAKWWQHFLHNQSALMIKAALTFKKNKVVTSVRHHLDD